MSKHKLLNKRHRVAGEMRQDFITSKWVIIAPGRDSKPTDFAVKRKSQPAPPRYKADCPFCNLADFPQRPDVLRLPDDADNWQVHIFPNKYPALSERDELRSWRTGPYRATEAVGYHELLATRWHNQNDTSITTSQLALQLEALVLRYRQLREKMSVNYIQIIKNHGETAGASLAHPHLQIFALPVLPDDVRDQLVGAQARAKEHGREPFGVILDYEIRDGRRIIDENEYFVAFCPFAARFAFEVWIMPRRAAPYFENIDPTEQAQLAEILQGTLKRMEATLGPIDYNYSIYSAPCDETGFVCDTEQFNSFRWHVQVTPRLGSLGGLEIGSGLEVVTFMPETAAAYLREHSKVNV